MFEELKKIIKKSKSELTNFSVASIAIDKKNNKYVGINIESPILSTSICAEGNAINNSYTKINIGDIREIHILGNNKLNNQKDLFVYPCGVCRQKISEASNHNAKIFIYNLNGDVKEHNIKDLLPNPFVS